jgi:hypothetical protein
VVVELRRKIRKIFLGISRDFSFSIEVLSSGSLKLMKNRTVNETPDPLNAENPPQIPHSNPTTNCFESY